MSGYHRASRALEREGAFDKEAKIMDVAGRLVKLLGGALPDMLSTVKNLGLAAASKLTKTLETTLSGLERGTRARFAKAIMSLALASGALAAQGCAVSLTRIEGGLSYREYSRRPAVVRVVRHGLPERDVRRMYIHVSGGHRPGRRDVRRDRHPVISDPNRGVRDVREDRHPTRPRRVQKSRP